MTWVTDRCKCALTVRRVIEQVGWQRIKLSIRTDALGCSLETLLGRETDLGYPLRLFASSLEYLNGDHGRRLDVAWMCKKDRALATSDHKLSQNKGLVPPRIHTLDRLRALRASRVDAD
jgi:hypothetical protein